MKLLGSTRTDALSEGLARHGRNALLGMGCGLVLMLLVSSWGQGGASVRALGELQLQAERTGRLDSMLIQILDAENGVRGYLLTRNRNHLEPYLNSLATVKYTLEDLRQDEATWRQSEAELAQLTGLITIKMRMLSDEVARGRVADEGAAEGKRYMDAIRKTLADIKARTVAHGQRSLEESTAHVEQTRWVVATLSAGALALMLALFVVLRRQMMLREQIAGLLRQENRRLEAQVRARTAELSDLASYLTNAREAEQARLGRELHDELGALLTAARMDIAWILRKLDPSALQPHRERFDRLIRTIDNGIMMKRRITDALRPPLLQELGLVAALRMLGEEFAHNAPGVRTTLELPEADIDLPDESALALYRIAQESLTNIRRHARASNVKLSLQWVTDALRLVIEDDGVGFDPDTGARGHHGMAGMRHRVQMFSGDIDIDSAPGAGTRIVVSMPMAESYATMSP